MQMGAAEQIGRDLWVIDTLFQGEPGVIASYLLAGDDGLALVDVGSDATVEQLLAGIRAAGFDPSEIRHLVLTHIHLDHAGAAGALVQRIPQAQVYVHSLGAPHLANPVKLISSARRIYGEAMERLWGSMEPVPEDHLHILEDGQSISVGGRTLRALYTPGHAIHHLAYFDEEHRELFAGDVAGVRLQGSAFVRPPTPPPDLNLEDWYASVDRIAALDARALYLAHYGCVHDVSAHLAQLRLRLGWWGEMMLTGLRQHKSDDELAKILAEASDAEITRDAADDTILLERYEIASNYLMSAQGYRRYYQKTQPEMLASLESS
jgi:glyoxylase-like metal-dependent hydrolase (beta-lactamase superfamily II)